MTRRADAATTSKPGLVRALGLIDVVAGLWLLSAPFVLSYPHTYPHQRALFNDLLVGALVSMLALLHLVQWNSARWASRGIVGFALWLLLAPIIFNYRLDPTIGSAALVSDIATGVVLLLGAALSLAGSKDE